MYNLIFKWKWKKKSIWTLNYHAKSWTKREKNLHQKLVVGKFHELHESNVRKQVPVHFRWIIEMSIRCFCLCDSNCANPYHSIRIHSVGWRKLKSHWIISLKIHQFTKLFKLSTNSLSLVRFLLAEKNLITWKFYWKISYKLRFNIKHLKFKMTAISILSLLCTVHTYTYWPVNFSHSSTIQIPPKTLSPYTFVDTGLNKRILLSWNFTFIELKHFQLS